MAQNGRTWFFIPSFEFHQPLHFEKTLVLLELSNLLIRDPCSGFGGESMDVSGGLRHQNLVSFGHRVLRESRRIASRKFALRLHDRPINRNWRLGWVMSKLCRRLGDDVGVAFKPIYLFFGFSTRSPGILSSLLSKNIFCVLLLLKRMVLFFCSSHVNWISRIV